MTIREMSCDAFDCTIDGVAKRCAVDGNKKVAMEIAAELLDLSNSIVASISDDGKMDDLEKQAVKSKFKDGLAQRIPDESFWFLGTIWGIVKSWLKKVQEKIHAKIQ